MLFKIKVCRAQSALLKKRDKNLFCVKYTKNIEARGKAPEIFAYIPALALCRVMRGRRPYRRGFLRARKTYNLTKAKVDPNRSPALDRYS